MAENIAAVLKVPISATPNFWDLKKHINSNRGVVGNFSLGSMENIMSLPLLIERTKWKRSLLGQQNPLRGFDTEFSVCTIIMIHLEI